MPNQSSTNWTTIAMLGVGVWLANKVVFSETEEEQQVKKATKKLEKNISGNPFNFNTFVKPRKVNSQYRLTLNIDRLLKATKIIWDGIDIFEDDEAEILSGIKMARTKTDIAAIAATYAKRYKVDLYGKLRKNLGKKELGRINRYVINLPNYANSGYRK